LGFGGGRNEEDVQRQRVQHMLAGDTVKARAEYQAVLARWKDGDFAMLKEEEDEVRWIGESPQMK
jgi:hypothetical protein